MIYGFPLAIFEVLILLGVLKAPTTHVSVSLVPVMLCAQHALFRAKLQLLHRLRASISLLSQVSLFRQLPGPQQELRLPPSKASQPITQTLWIPAL
jgi:hypothetical protein